MGRRKKLEWPVINLCPDDEVVCPHCQSKGNDLYKSEESVDIWRPRNMTGIKRIRYGSCKCKKCGVDWQYSRSWLTEEEDEKLKEAVG